MLNGDAAAQRFHAFQVAVGNRLAMVEEPVQSFERHFAIHFLEHIQEARDAFVVGRVQAERPLVGREQRHDFLEFAFQRRGQVGTRFKEVFKIRRRENQHFARAVAAEEIVAFARPGHLDPAREVFLLLLRLLREEIVGDAKRQSRRACAVRR